MKLKKIPLTLIILILTMGASLTLGFLSFGGMLALAPVLPMVLASLILPLAVAAFIMSTAYEGEIILQNIRESMKKLTQRRFLKRFLAREYLLNHFPQDDDRPQFFNDYEAQLRYVYSLPKGKTRKAAKKDLRHKEKWFAECLFNDHRGYDEYKTELLNWLKKPRNPNTPTQDEMIDLARKRKILFHLLKIFSALSGFFIGLGTAYLIMEAVMAIPFLAALLATPAFALPFFLIAGLGVIAAGAAYGLLTYNAFTDIINHHTLRKMINNFTTCWTEGLTLRNIASTLGFAFVLSMIVLLTVCTAGTWWTIAKNTAPLLPGIAQLPEKVRKLSTILLTIFSGVSGLGFNGYNGMITLDQIKGDHHHHGQKLTLFQRLTRPIASLHSRENPLQMVNLPRLVIKLTFTPLKLFLFFCHLLSIALLGDRVPGIPQLASILIGITSEFFEDAHRFNIFSHDHEDCETDPLELNEMLKRRLSIDGGHHHHDNDIPTHLLKIIFSPLFVSAIVWDWGASKLNQEKPKLSLLEACQKYRLFILDYWPTVKKGLVALNIMHVKEEPEQGATPSSVSRDWEMQHDDYLAAKAHRKQQSVYGRFFQPIVNKAVGVFSSSTHVKPA